MSNEHTHDTNETTGARLTLHMTNDDMERLRAAFSEYSRYVATDDRTDTPRGGMPTRMLMADRIVQTFLYHLLADRAALVKDNATLLSQRDDAWSRHMQAEARIAALVAEVADLKRLRGLVVAEAARLHQRTEAAETQVAAMRPLVERIARGDFHEFYVSIFGDTCCIGCNATASTHIGFTHDDDCIVQAARALAATWAGQTPAAPTPDGQEGGEG
jgi:hypothetical protein